jgi:hypothetical protein
MLTAIRTSDQVIREYCSGLTSHTMECKLGIISFEMAQNCSGDKFLELTRNYTFGVN